VRYLVDANVLSEATKPNPDSRVVEWLRRNERSIGVRWAQLLADLRRHGKPMSIKDSLIAATALAHDLTLVTLNQRDFKPAQAQLVDPSA
jgi:hypothetical protein